MASVDEFVNIIHAFMGNDNAIRQQAEQRYKQLTEQPDMLIGLMMTCIVGAPQPDVRTMSAILLRRQFLTPNEENYFKIDGVSPEARAAVRSGIIEAIQKEEERPVARTICDACGEIARRVFETGETWDDLLPFLFGSSQSPNPLQRENALLIFSRLAGFVGDALMGHKKLLLGIFNASLQDIANTKVRLAGLQAATCFLMAIKDQNQLMEFQPLMPAMLQTISDALNTGDEENAVIAIQMFIDMAETKPKFLKKDLKEVINAMLTITTASSLSDTTRHCALEFLTVLAEKAPPMLRSYPAFLHSVVPATLNMMVEADDDPNWEDSPEFNDVVTNAEYAEQAIDRIACAVGGNAILPIVFNILPGMMQSPDWRFRSAALMCVSSIAEGCADDMESGLGQVVDMCLPGFTDPHHRVRYAACQCFGQLSIDFSPNFQGVFHAQVLTGLMSVMSDASHPKVQGHAAAALLNFAEECHSEIFSQFNYLEPLLVQLFKMLTTGQMKTQEHALSAIATLADNARAEFEKFYDTFMPPLKQIMHQANGDDFRALRGRAVEAVSMIGLAVGRERFHSDALETMNLMISIQAQNLKPDDPQAQFFIPAWTRIATCLREEFLPFLPVIMPPLLATAELKPVYSVTGMDEYESQEPGWQTINMGDKRLGIKTSELEDKAVATKMLVCMVRDLKDGIIDYLEEIADIMIPLLQFYFHDQVRTNAAESCPFILVALASHCVKVGAGFESLKAMFKYIIDALLEVIHAEVDMEVLVLQLEAFGDSISVAGENCFNDEELQEICKVMLVLMNQLEERRLKRKEETFDEDHDEAQKEEFIKIQSIDDLVLRMIVSVIDALFLAHGPAFVPHFHSLFNIFMILIQPDRSAAERQWAVCATDSLVEYGKDAALPYLSTFVEFTFAYVTDADPGVRQAAVYGLGIMGAVLKGNFSAYAARALDAIRQVVTLGSSDSLEQASSTDNAISAFVKIFSNVPGVVDEAAAVAQILSWLPLREDHIEGRLVYAWVCSMIEANNPAMLNGGSNIPPLIALLTSVLGTEFSEPTLQDRIVRIIQTVHGGLPAEAFAHVVAACKPGDQAKIQEIINSAH